MTVSHALLHAIAAWLLVTLTMLPIIIAPTVMSAGPTAYGGMEARMGVKNSAMKNRKEVKMAATPVRPPVDALKHFSQHCHSAEHGQRPGAAHQMLQCGTTCMATRSRIALVLLQVDNAAKIGRIPSRMPEADSTKTVHGDDPSRDDTTMAAPSELQQ